MPFEAAVVCIRAIARMIWRLEMSAINIALGMIIFSVVPVVGFCECGYTTTISTRTRCAPSQGRRDRYRLVHSELSGICC
jgi:hypothetical protein